MLDGPEFTDADLREALKEMGSYVDVTEEDLKKIYGLAIKHARQRLTMAVSVAEAMTRDVIAVGENDEIAEAVRLLSENRISGLPVIDKSGLVIGVVSEADILSAAGMESGFAFKDIIRRLLGEPLAGHRTGDTVGAIMSRPPITIAAGADIGDAAKILSAKRIKRLPVVADDGKLIGIISRADIVKASQRK